MKITLPNGTILEMPDTLTPAPQSVDTSAPAPEPTPPPKEPIAPSMPPAEAAQTETVGATDGPTYGGASNVSDPQAKNPNVFHFVAPREE